MVEKNLFFFCFLGFAKEFSNTIILSIVQNGHFGVIIIDLIIRVIIVVYDFKYHGVLRGLSW
jgi:hypothetical protein